MKKSTTFLLAVLGCWVLPSRFLAQPTACDTLVFVDGKIVLADILEKTTTEIHWAKCDDVSGTSFLTSLERVAAVRIFKQSFVSDSQVSEQPIFSDSLQTKRSFSLLYTTFLTSRDGALFSGALKSVGDSTIEFAFAQNRFIPNKTAVISINASKIERIELRRKGKVGVGLVLGLGLGVAVGAVIGHATDQPDDFLQLGGPVGGFIGGLSGLVVGGIIGGLKTRFTIQGDSKKLAAQREALERYTLD